MEFYVYKSMRFYVGEFSRKTEDLCKTYAVCGIEKRIS